MWHIASIIVIVPWKTRVHQNMYTYDVMQTAPGITKYPDTWGQYSGAVQAHYGMYIWI